MANKYLILLIMFLLPGCVSDRQETRLQPSSYPTPLIEESVLTYTITSDYGKEVTCSTKYSVCTGEGRKKMYQFPRGMGPPVRLEFVENRAKANLSDLNHILVRLGLPTVTKSVFETPDPDKPGYVRYLFDWDTLREGRLSLEVVLCVCNKPSITECPKETTKRMGGKYYYCVGKIEHVER